MNFADYKKKRMRKELRKCNYSDSISTTSSDRISTSKLQEVREQLLNSVHRNSTRKNYHGVWQNFNKFVIKLDWIPESWEERVSLYCAFMSENELQSSTMKSYISAIKAKLKNDGYKWNQELYSFSALTRACKLKSDRVKIRLPIRVKFLNCILFEIYRQYKCTQDWKNLYDRTLYLTAFLISSYGLFRIGEITKSDHVMKARDVHFSEDNSKLLIILHSSKTHGRGDPPQKVKLTAIEGDEQFCPVLETYKYTKLRREYITDDEQFLIHHDGSPLLASEMRTLLRKSISDLGLEAELYDTHSLRIGRATDLFKSGWSVDRIKKLGRWKSNAVYKYLRDY